MAGFSSCAYRIAYAGLKENSFEDHKNVSGILYRSEDVRSGRIKLHTLLIFSLCWGGVEAFGIMGLFIGPVVLSVTLVVLGMLRETNLDYTAAKQPRTVSPGGGKGKTEHYVS